MVDLSILVVILVAAADMVRRLMRSPDAWLSWRWTLDAFVIGAAGSVSVSQDVAEGLGHAIEYGAIVAFVATLCLWVLVPRTTAEVEHRGSRTERRSSFVQPLMPPSAAGGSVHAQTNGRRSDPPKSRPPGHSDRSARALASAAPRSPE
jgi:hypothetical protein